MSSVVSDGQEAELEEMIARTIVKVSQAMSKGDWEIVKLELVAIQILLAKTEGKHTPYGSYLRSLVANFHILEGDADKAQKHLEHLYQVKDQYEDPLAHLWKPDLYENLGQHWEMKGDMLKARKFRTTDESKMCCGFLGCTEGRFSKDQMIICQGCKSIWYHDTTHLEQDRVRHEPYCKDVESIFECSDEVEEGEIVVEDEAKEENSADESDTSESSDGTLKEGEDEEDGLGDLNEIGEAAAEFRYEADKSNVVSTNAEAVDVPSSNEADEGGEDEPGILDAIEVAAKEVGDEANESDVMRTTEEAGYSSFVSPIVSPKGTATPPSYDPLYGKSPSTSPGSGSKPFFNTSPGNSNGSAGEGGEDKAAELNPFNTVQQEKNSERLERGREYLKSYPNWADEANDDAESEAKAAEAAEQEEAEKTAKRLGTKSKAQMKRDRKAAQDAEKKAKKKAKQRHKKVTGEGKADEPEASKSRYEADGLEAFNTNDEVDKAKEHESNKPDTSNPSDEADEVNAFVPIDEPGATLPVEEPNASIPADESDATLPVEEPSAFVPIDESDASIPGEKAIVSTSNDQADASSDTPALSEETEELKAWIPSPIVVNGSRGFPPVEEHKGNWEAAYVLHLLYNSRRLQRDASIPGEELNPSVPIDDSNASVPGEKSNASTSSDPPAVSKEQHEEQYNESHLAAASNLLFLHNSKPLQPDAPIPGEESSEKSSVSASNETLKASIPAEELNASVPIDESNTSVSGENPNASISSDPPAVSEEQHKEIVSIASNVPSLYDSESPQPDSSFPGEESDASALSSQPKMSTPGEESSEESSEEPNGSALSNQVPGEESSAFASSNQNTLAPGEEPDTSTPQKELGQEPSISTLSNQLNTPGGELSKEFDEEPNASALSNHTKHVTNPQKELVNEPSLSTSSNQPGPLVLGEESSASASGNQPETSTPGGELGAEQNEQRETSNPSEELGEESSASASGNQPDAPGPRDAPPAAPFESDVPNIDLARSTAFACCQLYVIEKITSYLTGFVAFTPCRQFMIETITAHLVNLFREVGETRSFRPEHIFDPEVRRKVVELLKARAEELRTQESDYAFLVMLKAVMLFW